MSIIDWLTGKKSSKINEIIPKNDTSGFTPLGNSGPICPYCSFKFDKMPLKKKKCPNCNNSFFSRERPFDFKKVLIKEDEIEELNRQWAKKHEQYPSFSILTPLEILQKGRQQTIIANRIMMNTDDFEGIPRENLKQIRLIIADGFRREMDNSSISFEIVQKVDGIDIKRANTLTDNEIKRASKIH